MTSAKRGEYLKPEDVSSSQAERVLVFLNAAKTAEEIASTIEIPGERDVGLGVARNILDQRVKLGKFKDLSQLYDVPQVGPERFSEIVKTLSIRKGGRDMAEINVKQLSEILTNLGIAGVSADGLQGILAASCGSGGCSTCPSGCSPKCVSCSTGSSNGGVAFDGGSRGGVLQDIIERLRSIST